MEVSAFLVGAPVFKTGGRCSAPPAGSIPVHLRHRRPHPACRWWECARGPAPSVALSVLVSGSSSLRHAIAGLLGNRGAGGDELSLGSIRARLARLSEADLAQLRQYEERHGARPDVLSMLANRLIKVRQAG